MITLRNQNQKECSKAKEEGQRVHTTQQSFFDDPARLPDLPLRSGEHLNAAHPHHGVPKQRGEAQAAAGQGLDRAVGRGVHGYVLIHLENASPRHELPVVAVVHRARRSVVKEDGVVHHRRLRAPRLEHGDESGIHVRVRFSRSIVVVQAIQDERAVRDPNRMTSCKCTHTHTHTQRLSSFHHLLCMIQIPIHGTPREISARIGSERDVAVPPPRLHRVRILRPTTLKRSDLLSAEAMHVKIDVETLTYQHNSIPCCDRYDISAGNDARACTF
ncbi:hypothetical protein B296_00021728 [Ensete ventricosum]|uniref:Uncharacterized protein n=1 Tax=Ensete ventricosum TaxID=4639 RepID=A0A427AF70_ENSVE|nr:hypothetical protein B296_00021728 [Ensete ventricosum]